MKIDVNFDSVGFEKDLKKQLENKAATDYQNQLRRAGILGVTVKVKMLKGDDLDINLSGPDDQVEKAKKFLSE